MAGVSYIGDMGYVPADYVDKLLDDLRASGRKVLAKAEAVARAGEGGREGAARREQGRDDRRRDPRAGAQGSRRHDRARHARSPRPAPRVMGSDAEAVLRDSRVPVLLVRSARARGARQRRRRCARESATARASGPVSLREPINPSRRSCNMAHAIRIHATGGPEVMQFEEVDVGDPGPGEARVRHAAIGVNYIDTYHRSGLYPLPLPTGSATRRRASSKRSAPASTGSSPAIASRYCRRPARRVQRRRASCPPTASSSCPTASTTARRRR